MLRKWTKGMGVALSLAVSLVPITGLSAETGQAAKSSDLPAATIEKASLLIACRVWAKMNVELFETNTAYWKDYYSKAYDRVISLGIPEARIGPAQENIAQSLNSAYQESIGVYVDYLNYDMAKQAADFRAKTFANFDKDCPAALN